MVTQIWVNIGSGNGLLPDGTKPLPEPMFIVYHQWGLLTITSGLFPKRDLSHQSLKLAENYLFKIPFKFPRHKGVNISLASLFISHSTAHIHPHRVSYVSQQHMTCTPQLHYTYPLLLSLITSLSSSVITGAINKSLPNNTLGSKLIVLVSEESSLTASKLVLRANRAITAHVTQSLRTRYALWQPCCRDRVWRWYAHTDVVQTLGCHTQLNTEHQAENNKDIGVPQPGRKVHSHAWSSHT